jgi:hypothetical protein
VVALRTVVNEAMEARPLIEQNGHESHSTFRKSHLLDADATRLGQALLNLVNAASG